MTVTTDRLTTLTKIHAANERAKELSRRGECGTRSDAYSDAHELIDWLLMRLGY